jgi:hypothetical protein
MLLYWILYATVTQYYYVIIIILYYNLIGPLSCMRSVVDRNVVMRRTPVPICWSVTWVDTRTLNKMATHWSRIKTLHDLQKMRSGSKQKFSQLCALTWLVLMRNFPSPAQKQTAANDMYAARGGGSFSHHQHINCKWARWTNYCGPYQRTVQ